MSIYTDLAAEARELHPAPPGVQEEQEQLGEIAVSRIEITDDEAARALEKQRGRYITLDAPALAARELSLFAALSRAVCGELTALMPDIPENAAVLVVGLGNRAVTPDSLGPRMIEQIYVTRHITQYLPEAFDAPIRAVCAIAPGVLGVTGVETLEIVRGVVEHVQPALIVVADALASRRAARISTTIQMTDSGISPGSGVGNPRAGISFDTFHIPVVALGVPMVVYASTITRDALELIAGEANDAEALQAAAEEAVAAHFGPMIMTPKDIDVIVSDMSRILADGINMALFGASYEAVRTLVL